MPKVSVIVPNYNHAPYLEQRIDSILAQTYQDFELILLDDCSTDNSREILNRYKDHPKVTHLVFNEQNSGSPFRQWNKGIELADGEYVWIAESDDWAEPEFLEKLIAEVTQHPTIGLAYTLASYVSTAGEKLWETIQTGEVHIYSGNELNRKTLLLYNSIFNVSMTLFRRDLFCRINHSLYENMKLCGDWFFYVLLCEHTDVLELEEVYSNYRVHGQNCSIQAEVTGKTFLEGIDIVDYICQKQKDLDVVGYSFHWARQWVKYRKRYHFSHETNHQIKKKLFRNHKSILWFYYLLRIFYVLKNK